MLVPVQQGKPPDQVENKCGENTQPEPAKSFDNTVGMTMVPIRAGSFRMGSTKAEQDSVLKSVDQKFRKGVQDWLDTEGPQHEVRISKSFYMAAHPVTVGQFRQFVEEAR